MPKSHPLSDVSLTVSNFKCFGEEECGFELFQPINIIIGRNNTGKSALLDMIELCISNGGSYDAQIHSHFGSTYNVRVRQILDEKSLLSVFQNGTQGGGVPDHNHAHYGKRHVGKTLQKSFLNGWRMIVEEPTFLDIAESSRANYQERIGNSSPWPFENLRLLKVAAERDVRPENSTSNRDIAPNGNGATNLVRAFINVDALPREEVERGLLKDLNAIYKGDSNFTRILCQEIADSNQWELFLEEDAKGDIRLSQSGSSLKSVFIILCMLRLRPIIEKIEWKQIVFAVEEPENNLHPALLRRLLDFLADQRDEKGFTLIVTTHSPIGIDWSARRSDSQIIHVRHNGKSASTRVAAEYQHNREILEDMDIRASDLLQANGVIWVEGPSDRIYLRRWIELVSDGALKEGTHYTIMFYGGKLLNHLDVLPPDESENLISLLAINRNVAVLIDSDRHPGNKATAKKPKMNLNTTKRRIRGEVEDTGGYVWITEGREVENYTPIEVFAGLVGKKAAKVDQYAQIASLPLLKSFKGEKVPLAHAAAEKTNKDDLVGHLDVVPRLEELCEHIRRWNSIEM